MLIGGGLYAPEPRQLYRVRTHVAANLRRLRTIVESPAFRRSFGELSGQCLQRVPRGFDKDDPAAEYLKLRQFLVGREHPASYATRPRFYGSLLRLFGRLSPLIRFLNESLVDVRRFRH